MGQVESHFDKAMQNFQILVENAKGGLKAKQILAENDEGGLKLRSNDLKRILLADGVINKPVIVISVTGASLKGKSLLMDMILRHLRGSDWLKGNNTDGFMSQLGRRRHTTGIMMWSELFPVTLPTGEEAVIVLMDTQGTVDDQSTVHKSHAVHALSTLLSSLQIFNVMGNVNDDDLEHLQPFIEYGRMVLDETSTSSFQKLLFLVRDWKKIDEFPLGEEGGDRLVTKWAQNQSGKKKLESVRNHIGDCFSDINGFLLPHPGQQVASSPDFDGSSDDMDPAFVTGLKDLISKILAPENLTVKVIAGNPLTARDLYTFFTSYVNLFPSDELPKPENIMQATVEASHTTAVQEAKLQYVEELECLLRENQPSLDQDNLVRKHREAATRAENTFNDRKKMGDEKMSQDHLKILVKEMEEWFGHAEQANMAKREKERLVAEEKKREDNEDHIKGLIDTCTRMYISGMEPVVGTVDFVPGKDMGSAQNAAKEKAMNTFDVKSRSHSVEWDSRFKLARVIGTHFRLMRHHNDMKKDAKNQQAARENMKAVELAHKCYQTVINGTTSGVALNEEELERQHQLALQAAIDTFESLKEGEEHIIAGYLDGLKELIDEDLEMKTYSLPSNRRKKAQPR